MRRALLLIAVTLACAPGCCLWHFHSSFPFVETPGKKNSPDLELQQVDDGSIVPSSVYQSADNHQRGQADSI